MVGKGCPTPVTPYWWLWSCNNINCQQRVLCTIYPTLATFAQIRDCDWMFFFFLSMNISLVCGLCLKYSIFPSHAFLEKALGYWVLQQSPTGDWILHDTGKIFASTPQIFKLSKPLYVVCDHMPDKGDLSDFETLHSLSLMWLYFNKAIRTT